MWSKINRDKVGALIEQPAFYPYLSGRDNLRVVAGSGPAVAQVRAALTEVTAKPGEVVGRVRLTVPRSAFHFVTASAWRSA